MKSKILFITMAVALMALTGCGSSHGDTSIPLPEYISEVKLDEDYNVIDLGRAGQSTPDGNYFYDGWVRLYSENGGSCIFDCYEGRPEWKEDTAVSYMAVRSIILAEIIM